MSPLDRVLGWFAARAAAKAAERDRIERNKRRRDLYAARRKLRADMLGLEVSTTAAIADQALFDAVVRAAEPDPVNDGRVWRWPGGEVETLAEVRAELREAGPVATTRDRSA